MGFPLRIPSLLLLAACRERGPTEGFDYLSSEYAGHVAAGGWALDIDGDVISAELFAEDVSRAGVFGAGAVIHDIAWDGRRRVVVGSDADGTGAIWWPYDVAAAEADYPAGAARWLDGELWALEPVDSSCEWGSATTRIGPVPCVGREAFALAPDGTVAFATGDALEIHSSEGAVVVDVPAVRVVWDLDGERFVAAGRWTLHGVDAEGEVAWESTSEEEILGLVSMWMGAVTMSEAELGDGRLDAWGHDGELLTSLATPTTADTLRGSSDGERLGVGVDADVHVFRFLPPER